MKDSHYMKLMHRRTILKQYLLEKFEEDDFHGVQDAASDLRDIDSEIKGYIKGTGLVVSEQPTEAAPSLVS